MPSRIPFDSSETHLEQSVELDGQGYEFELKWHQRSERWLMSLRTDAGDSVFEQRPVAASTNMLDYNRASNTPPGDLIIVGPSDYEREDLDDGLKVFYFAADEITIETPPPDYEITSV